MAASSGLVGAIARMRLAADGCMSEADFYRVSNLTANQLQIWLAQNLLPDVPIFNLSAGLHLNGEIDIECFKRAFSVLVHSTDALRTRVKQTDGIPRQRILPWVSSKMTTVDFSAFPDARDRARGWMEAHCRTPVNWRGRLFDSALIRLGEERFIWYVNIHHLICDGWSFELIYRRMADLYQCAREQRLPETVVLPRFADYVAFERDYRASARHRKTEEYWRAFLTATDDRLEFYGRVPDVMTTHVRRVSRDLGLERTRKLKAVAGSLASGTRQAALFDIFGAVLIAYLHCLNDHDSYTVGVPFHNRRSGSSFKETIGFFSEVLPVRVGVTTGETFASLLHKFKGEVRRTLRYGQYAVGNPLFKRVYDVTLNYHTRSFSDFAGIPATPEWIHNGHGDESLAVQVHDFAAAESLMVDFDLHEAVFAARDAERVTGHYLRVLDAFLREPNMPLRQLSLGSEKATQRLLCQRVTSVADIAGQQFVPQLFQDRVRETPEQPAVLSENESLTYKELDCRAASISAVLRKRGIGPTALVVIFLTRSPTMIAAMLGVLKTGAAYAPVDPLYSSEWLKFILENTHAAVLLTERQLLDRVPEGSAEIVCLEEDVLRSHEAVDEPQAAVCGDELAYVIYTSGSTGRPKGVEVTHAALANFARHAAEIFEIKPSDRILQFSSVAFDTSVEEIFPCLISGGSLVLRTNSMSTDATDLLDHCRTLGVTVLDLPTAYWHELAVELFAGRRMVAAPIRLVIIGGEKAMPERLALWQAFVADNVRLLNTYGPTETTVAATVADLTQAPSDCGGVEQVAIGRPIANVQALVLDRNLHLTPDGVPGELYIGGAGLARGYVGQPDLTAEKFIPNPFAGSWGSRLYRTGDIARYREDGNIEFLRRGDDQVKIRGFRVEPEGTAAVLRQHPLIRDAVVLADAGNGSTRLVAYVVAEGPSGLNPKDVQNFLRARLPDYMIPADFVSLDLLPLTPRGKLDRDALRSMQQRQCTACETLAPPQTPLEERIAKLWRELLALEVVGREQHFFEIGGNSLLAARAISRLTREFGVEIPLRAIFEAPTIALLGERVEQITREPQAAEDTVPVIVGSHNGHAPASDSQARIWYMDQLAPESSAYNISAAIRFTGILDRDALRQSLDRLIERHESLRTTIDDTSGEPVQVIAPTLRLELPEIDLSSYSAELRLDSARQILREEGRRPFDLRRGPLLRVLLLQLGDQDHILLLSMHHLISDQWSLGVIAREISSFYNRGPNAAPSPVETVPVQYGDFAVWQSRRLTSERLQDDLGYWKRQLAGVQPAAVPADHPRPAIQSFRGAHQTLALSKELIAKLKTLAVGENATLYMVFLAGFKVLLSRYSGREDVALGSPVANRSLPEWEDVIGTFINLLVLRTNLAGNPSLLEVIGRVREVVLEAFTHQEMPFQKLVAELAPDRDPSRSPLVQVLFNFQSAPIGNVDFEGISWAPFEFQQWASQFDLSVTVDAEITRKIFLSYNTDLYDEPTIARLLSHYREVLEALAANAGQSLANVSRLLAPTQQDPTGNRLTYPEACFHELFEAEAGRNPNRVAAVYEDRQFTYGQLNERANRWARRLRDLGVGAETRVGICAERSLELVAGLLAIAKAGGAYVPIDPAYPKDRIEFILKDSAVATLITHRCLLAQLPELDVPLLCLDDEAETERVSAENLAPLAGPDQLAYVIYTSGSTGRPKGVQITHRALISFLYSMRERPGIEPTDVLLSVTTISFDIAALELFLPLITGSRVVIASRDTVADGNALVALLRACGASVMQATPTTWRMMMESGWKGSTDFKAICGGESLPPDLARELTVRSHSVWNVYGPTETTVWSSIWRVESSCERVLIGCPIHNTQIHILDRNLDPVPVGGEGEIYIGGEGLARGYLGRPELTAEKFVPNSLGAPSSRLYRTGDWGRCLPDDSVEFIGRIDNQIKLRGFRIELGEVEAVLSSHDGVKQAVVAVKGEGAEKRLVAYVVAREETSVTECDLARFVKDKLPPYMLPSAFMFLHTLPLTPNSKIDRRALPTPELNAYAPTVGARDRLEFEVANLWKRLLRCGALGLDDNFFDVGGNSLLAARLLADIETNLGKRIRLGDFFACPTVAHVVDLLRKNGYSPQWSSLVPIQPLGSKPPLFWVHGLSTNVRLPGYLGPDQPIYAFVPQSQDGKPALYTEIEQMAAHCVDELRSVQPEGPYFLGGYSFGGLLVFEVAQQLLKLGQQIALLALLDGTAPVKHKVRLYEQSRLAGGWRGCAYLTGRIGTGLLRRLRIKSIKKTVRRMSYKFFIAIDRDIPASCRTTYIADLHRKARRKYRPARYPGAVLFFRALANPDDPLSTWRNLFKGNLQVHPVPGNHQTIAQEPQFQIWAKKLKEALDHKQEDLSSGYLSSGETCLLSPMRADADSQVS